MNAPYPLRRLLPRKPVKLPEAALALLMVLGLAQIAMCLGEAFRVVPPTPTRLESAAHDPMYVTNAPVAGAAKPVRTEKS